MKKNLFQNHFAQMLEMWYGGLHSRAFLSLLEWWPRGTKKLCCSGFLVRTLNSGEQFRAILALLLGLFLKEKIQSYN